MSKLRQRLSRDEGFTLIELLIVVVIIGILAAIAIPKFANTKEKAYIASMKSDLRNLITAQEAYFSDNNSSYAASTTAMGTNYKSSTGVTVNVKPAVARLSTASRVFKWSASAPQARFQPSC
jgi:prepilin-type N-terminal cleavage/methylation domain-containing protein